MRLLSTYLADLALQGGDAVHALPHPLMLLAHPLPLPRLACQYVHTAAGVLEPEQNSPG